MRDDPQGEPRRGFQALAIWGSGGHAAVMRDAAEMSERFRVVAFLDNTSEEDREVDGLRVLGGPDLLKRVRREDIRSVHVAIGNSRARQRLSAQAAAAGFDLATIAHPRAVIARSSAIGAGSAIVAGAVVNPWAELGEGVIVNTSATVDHHCRIGDYAHLAPGSKLGGHASVGRLTWIGIGATLIDRIAVGQNCLIGAGAVVVRDIPDNAVAFGVPARIVRYVDAQ